MDTVEVTRLLQLWRDGQDDAFERLLPMVYQELKKTASAYIQRERADHTLQATDLVHNAYLKLAAAGSLDAKDRGHFFAVAARAMRRILVDHARGQHREKRVGAHRRVPLDEGLLASAGGSVDVVAVHDALETLAETHPRPARLVELRFFGGFSESEAAEILEVSRATLTRDWRFARVWLHRQMERS